MNALTCPIRFRSDIVHMYEHSNRNKLVGFWIQFPHDLIHKLNVCPPPIECSNGARCGTNDFSRANLFDDLWIYLCFSCKHHSAFCCVYDLCLFVWPLLLLFLLCLLHVDHTACQACIVCSGDIICFNGGRMIWGQLCRMYTPKTDILLKTRK